MSVENHSEEHHGQWWLAAQPEVRAQGVLRIAGDRSLSLELVGELGAVEVPGFDLPSGEYRIIGQTGSGRTISLNGCFATSVREPLGAPRQSWHVHEAVFDAIFDATEPWAFHGVRLSLPMLTSWVSPKNVAQHIEWNEDRTVKGMGVSLMMDSFPLWKHQGSTLQLIRSASISPASETLTQVESRLNLCIRADSAMEAEVLRGLARPMQMILGLSTGKFATATASKVLISETDTHYVDWKWQPLEIISEPRDVTHAFLYSHWKAAFDPNAERWIAKLDMIDPVVDLYLASLRQVGYAELSFLIVVQALETYHRRTSGETVLTPVEWKALQSCLKEAVNEFAWMRERSDQWRDVILGKLGDYFNEPSLSRRLRALFAELADLADEIAGEAVGRFVRRVVDARNYYTHWDVKKEKSVLRSRELVHATSRLLGLLELLLLRDIGFSYDSPAAQALIRRRISWLPGS